MIHDVLPFVVSGAAAGSIYAIAALGLVLTYKTSGVFNFAHGALAAVGAYVFWDLWVSSGWPWPVALGAAVALVGVVGGLVLEWMARALSDKPTAMRVVATVGLLVALQGLLVIRYTERTIPMPHFLPTTTVDIGGVNISYEQMIVSAAALALAAALSVFFRRARLGVAMQGVVDDPVLLGLQGTSPQRVRRASWMLGCCFAVVSGALLAPVLGLDATLLTLLVVQAFGAAAVGRFSSLTLTYIGGMVVGVGQEVLKYVVSQDALRDHVSDRLLGPLPPNLPFIVLFVVLVVTPGYKLVEHGARVVRRPRPPAPLARGTTMTGIAALAVLVAGAPLLLPAHRMPMLTTAAAYAVIFASLHLLVRTAGQVSLCHMTFAAVGAASTIHLRNAGVPFVLAVVLGGVIAMPVGALIAVPALRLSGVYLAIATLGFALLVERMLFSTWALFGMNLTLTTSRPAGFETDRAYYYLVAALAGAAVVLMLAVRRSRLGRLLRGLSDSPAAVAAHGADTTVIRTLAFCISAFLAAIGGALLPPITGNATGGTYNYAISLMLLAVLLLFGSRPVVAVAAASMAYIVAPGLLDDPVLVRWLPVLFGVAAVTVATGAPAQAWAAWTGGRRALERTLDRSPAQERLVPAS